jgi:mono/diheme cytochrome c family protein
MKSTHHGLSFHLLATAAAGLFALAAAGCERSATARFQPAAGELEQAQRQHVATLLEALFGTPDDPFDLSQTGVSYLDTNKLRLAAGPAWSDQPGYRSGLYRKHCVHCHGISGDGAGPTAAFLNPYPRDFRSGSYKFKSTPGREKPTDEDLRRILTHGIPGTAMPTFKLLPQAEIDALVEYVKYLSIRGEVEANLTSSIDEIVSNWKNADELKAVVIERAVKPVVEAWELAPESVTNPAEPRPEMDRQQSIRNGRELFHKADCYTCHGESGLGDGRLFWYNLPPDAPPQLTANRVPVHWVNPDLPTQQLRPRNLRMPYLRGGMRPIDLYRRIRNGLGGEELLMPGQSALTEEEIWNLVDYVLSLPHELQSPHDGLPRRAVAHSKQKD